MTPLPHQKWTTAAQPVVGMLHIPALPGSPRNRQDLATICDAVLRDAEALVAGGVHGLMLENFGDIPFYPGRVPAHAVAQMTSLAAEVRRRWDVPLGINVLRNDGRSALAIAHAVGAAFIRVNVLCGARVTDQGIIEGIAHDLLRERLLLGAADIEILADVAVKHSAPLAPRSLFDEVHDTLQRGCADAVIISGSGTGQPTEIDEVTAAKSAAGAASVFVGSGISPESIERYLPHADGFIVGTALKHDGLAANPVDPDRVRQLMRHVRGTR
jgi:membrane complex biogenesis BtpA family protein